MKNIIIILSLISAAFLTQSCKKTSQDDEERQASKATVAVVTDRVKTGDVAVTVDATGMTDASRKEKVLAPAAGWIASFKALEGTSFTTGDVMAVIRPKEAQAAIAGAETLLRSAQTEKQKAEAQHALDIAQASQAGIEVRAKFNGIVATRSVMEGELVAENAEMFTLIDLSTVNFVADVPLQLLPKIHIQQQATVHLESLAKKDYDATVEAINPQTDVQSQTVKVRLKFSLASFERLGLKTDIMGTVRIITAVHRQALIVPRSALLRDDENETYSVVVMNPDSLAHITPVSIGVLTDSTVEIISGIEKEMTVITRGNYALPDSTRVSIETQGSR
jgi:multidrug efflux pump subunit AcrA (membrane-fusion protein)